MTAADLDTTIRRSSNVLRQALQNVKGRQQMTIRLIGAPTIEQPTGRRPFWCRLPAATTCRPCDTG